MGRPLHNCFSFTDGTIRSVCRPDENQRVIHSGHKRVYSLKFQSVVLLNDMIANLHGPVCDSFKLNKSLLMLFFSFFFGARGLLICLISLRG